MQSKIPQRALDIINREKDEKTGVLNLNNCGLTEWPEEIFEMEWLEVLILGKYYFNKIEEIENVVNKNNLLFIHCEINRLINLKTLSFQFNSIKNLDNLNDLAKLEILDMGFNLISKIHKIEKLVKLKVLNLQNNKIEIIENLESLKSLEFLYLQNNNLVKIDKLDHLNCLKTLYLSRNKIYKIENLENQYLLENLYLSNNQISKIEELDTLGNLRMLSLHTNNITKIENLNNLNKLINLNLSNNHIKSIENINLLANINYLDLSHNEIFQITNILNLKLTELNLSNNHIRFVLVPEIIDHKTLKKLKIAGNPIFDLDINLINNINSHLKTIRIWYYNLINVTNNNFFKVCLLGNGRAGKSSLLDRLERNIYDPNKDSSHGIIINHSENWSDVNGNSVTIQYWDFGGQDLYHGTHKWFLKGDHLNLLVWNKNIVENNNQQNIDHSLQYWLSICERCNNQNKILITQTKKEMDGLGIPDEFDLLKEKYNLINNFIHVDSKPDDPKINNIDALRAAIQNHLSNSPILNQKIPLSYHKVRSKIIEKSKKEVEIDFDEFRAVCKDCGVGEFTDFDESCNLCLRWLQVSGIVFYNEHILSSRIIIDQKWAIDAVYKAFDRTSELYKTIIKNQGRFLLSDLYAELNEYSDHERQRVLDYLQSSYIIFEVGYNYYKTPEERTFICPRFLPNVDANKISESLSLRIGRTRLKSENYFDSDFDDIISVLGQKGFLNPAYIYKNCVLLEDKNERYLLYKDNNGHPEILGHSNFDGLFRPFSATLSDIGLNFTYSSVEGIMVTRDYEPKEVVDLSIKIFVSYAHGYQEASDLFINKLSNFLGSSATYEIKIWSDHDIFLGEDWHNRIQAEIKKSDLSILLLSDDFFNSKYIKNNEMNVFIDQQRESGYPFIPIYFSPCEYKDWEAIKKSQLFKPDKDDFEEVNSKDFAFTSLLYKGPSLVDGAENSPNVNYYFKMLRRKLEEVFMNIKK